MSASLANDSRARPNVFGSSTTDMTSPWRFARGEPVEPRARRTEPYHFADDDGARPRAIDIHCVRGELTQRSSPRVLLRRPRVHDDGGGCAAGPATIEQVA